MKGRLESLSLRAGWLPGPGEESGPILTVGCGLHLSSSVWQEQPVAPGQFLSGLRDGFLPSDDEGITWLQVRTWVFTVQTGPRLPLKESPLGAPTSIADMTIENPSRKYSHNHPVPSCSQSCWQENITGPLIWKAFTSGPPPVCKHLGKDHAFSCIVEMLMVRKVGIWSVYVEYVTERIVFSITDCILFLKFSCNPSFFLKITSYWSPRLSQVSSTSLSSTLSHRRNKSHIHSVILIFKFNIFTQFLLTSEDGVCIRKKEKRGIT